MYLSPNFYTYQHSIALFVDFIIYRDVKKCDSGHQITARLPPGFWHLRESTDESNNVPPMPTVPRKICQGYLDTPANLDTDIIINV